MLPFCNKLYLFGQKYNNSINMLYIHRQSYTDYYVTVEVLSTLKAV